MDRGVSLPSSPPFLWSVDQFGRLVFRVSRPRLRPSSPGGPSRRLTPLQPVTHSLGITSLIFGVKGVKWEGVLSETSNPTG